MTLERHPNLNALCGCLLARTLARLGLVYAVISPGSRSTPLVWGLTRTPGITCVPVLDERSAGFFALGLAKARGLPVALVCTSGSAAAHYFPAIIEASLSGVPLLVLTADRPPELRGCGSGQTIDQVKLFGDYPRWQSELALPVNDARVWRHLRQTLVQAWHHTLAPVPGPVHLNLPFRDPLAPIETPGEPTVDSDLDALTDWIEPVSPPAQPAPDAVSLRELVSWLNPKTKGLIVAGPADPRDPEAYIKAINHLANQSGWPVLADAANPLRHHRRSGPLVISTYETLLRDTDWADAHRPARVIIAGSLPTSKTLSQWLEKTEPLVWLIDAARDWREPLHARTRRLARPVESLASAWPSKKTAVAPLQGWGDVWEKADATARRRLDRNLSREALGFEGKIAWLLARHLPPHTTLHVANSMPVRDAEFFMPPQNKAFRVSVNRGANGIDGTLSTAMGLAEGGSRPVVLVCGDLALLHDSAAWALAAEIKGSLTVILVDNQGGGIFEHLPIAACEPPFERFFATPPAVAPDALAKAYGIPVKQPPDWKSLIGLLKVLPRQGTRLIVVKTDRKRDRQQRRALLG